MFLAHNFALSDAEDNTSCPLNRGGITDLPLLWTLLAILQRLLTWINFNLDSEDLFYWYKPETWFLWAMGATQAVANHGDEWGLTWYLRWGIYTSIPTCTHSLNSLATVEARSLKISSHETSLDHFRVTNSMDRFLLIFHFKIHG